MVHFSLKHINLAQCDIFVIELTWWFDLLVYPWIEANMTPHYIPKLHLHGMARLKAEYFRSNTTPLSPNLLYYWHITFSH
jgi:hypothetical protein